MRVAQLDIEHRGDEQGIFLSRLHPHDRARLAAIDRLVRRVIHVLRLDDRVGLLVQLLIALNGYLVFVVQLTVVLSVRVV